ncbi:MAG: RHH-type proline utilization regulon transcriptional repressor/proline dehydrogenase, partial [Verrucomicrobiales bacterium]
AENLFEEISTKRPSLFDTSQWSGKLMAWAMSRPDFRLRLLRFIDAFPAIRTPQQLQRMIQEYFADGGTEIPAVLRVGAKSTALFGKMGNVLLGGMIRKNIELLARQFMVGANTAEAVTNVETIRKDGFAVVCDLLGEAVVSEVEADAQMETYLRLLDKLDETEFTPLAPTKGNQDWNTQPVSQISIKPSALYSKIDPANFEGSVKGVLSRLERIAEKAMKTGAALCLDMESYNYKEVTLEVFRRLRSNPKFAAWPHFGIVLQAYLRETEADLRKLLLWMRQNDLPSSIRLVKGAFWDYETIVAEQHGWPNRVWSNKLQTDANFEKCTRVALENADFCYLQCASHNVRSIAATLETAIVNGVPADRYEFQVLYGMADPVRQSILKHAKRVRIYAPFGELVPGMAYLVRRILETTANESFLRNTFNHSGKAPTKADLLADPTEKLKKSPPIADDAPEQPFHNAPNADFTQESDRKKMREALSEIRRKESGFARPLSIGGVVQPTDEVVESVNPNRPSEVLGSFCLAGVDEAEQAIAAAKTAFKEWSKTPVSERSEILRKAATLLERRRWKHAAWQVLEVGKQWSEATADVDEAIDFLNYYAADAERLAGLNPLQQLLGERNDLTYLPRGVCSVIAPWNFPLAISVGMAAAAVVTGNTVVYKPSSQSALNGWLLVDLFREAGLPGGVFNYVPGHEGVIGDTLVDHPDVATIAFSGSRETGLRIIERAAVVHPFQRHVKRVIAEMGGKNAIIIDDDADLDQAVPAVLRSAFGFQGQKSSACSRVIVVDSVFERFRQRLCEAASSWKLGPSEDPEYDMGAMIDEKAQMRILKAAINAGREGRLIFQGSPPPLPPEDSEEKPAYYAPITIVDHIQPGHETAQNEIFGPVLSVMVARDFDQAIDWANRSDYALTGAVFSRTPSHLDQARREFDVGNLYLNRACTGAIVGRQAFGGAAMSGVGSKVGGPDYLQQFTIPRVVTENTMRRGFAPEPNG